MIPDHIIDKAVAAAGDNWVMVFDWEHDKLCTQVHAALEAVAADIWDEGWISRHDAGEMHTVTPNPYREAKSDRGP